MKRIIILLILFFYKAAFAQESLKEFKEKANLNFEKNIDDSHLNWKSFKLGNYDIKLDSINKIEGKFSLKIESNSIKNDSTNYALVYNDLVKRVVADSIEMSANIKYKGINDKVGLTLILLKNNEPIIQKDIPRKCKTEISDWEKINIKIPYNSYDVDYIRFGFYTTGHGTLWVDDVKLTFDDKELNRLEIFTPEKPKAQLDTVFYNGTSIKNIKSNKTVNQKLVKLCKIWGYLKYYHPNVHNGNLNWDAELIEKIPQILAIKDNKAESDFYIKWIKSLGEFEIENKVIDSSNVIFYPSIDFIHNSKFSKDLINKLEKIKIAKRQISNYYVEFAERVGNPVFKNEVEYSTFNHPDQGIYLITLFRYWNMINYFFPYKDIINQDIENNDWDNVLNEFVPKFLNIKNQLDYQLTCLELIEKIKDSHGITYFKKNVINEHLGKYFLNENANFILNKQAGTELVVTGYYNKDFVSENSLKIGDVIKKINGKKITKLFSKNYKYTPASNNSVKEREMSISLLRSKDSITDVEIERDNKRIKLILKAYKGLDRTIKFTYNDTCFKYINKNIAYLNVGSLKKEYLQNIFTEIKDTKGLIIDLRYYPKEFLVYNLAMYLASKPNEFLTFSRTDNSFPGLFFYGNTIKVGEINKTPYKGKVIVLVNENTQSQGEFTTMALSSIENVKVLGNITAGADGNLSSILLPGEVRTMISGIGVYYPDKSQTQRVGVKIDYFVHPTIEGIKEGKDELIEKAIELINN